MEWAETLSHRNKLLTSSDWTQLPDSGLTSECVENWRIWRGIVRQLRKDNHPDRNLVTEQINRLTRAKPVNRWADEPEIALPLLDNSFASHQKRVMDYMDVMFNDAATVKSFLEHPLLIDAGLRKAEKELGILGKIGILSRKIWSDKLFELNHRRNVSVARIFKLQSKYLEFSELVKNATATVELQTLQVEIKQWISTLT